MTDSHSFIAARDFLLAHRLDYETAYRDFHWPELDEFNWALDYFDTIAAGNSRPALHVLDENGAGTILSFADLSSRYEGVWSVSFVR